MRSGLADFAAEIQGLIDRALVEDLAWRDVTTEALLPPGLQGRASILAKAKGVLAGVEVAAMVFHRVDPSLQFGEFVVDGARVRPGDVVAAIEGALSSILRGERTALNFLGRLSGIASETARYVEAISGLGSRITDTRKTTPGWRALEKYAVRVGGGVNHRHNLADGILIKDNHLAALRSQGLGLEEAIERARRNAPHTLKVEVEVETEEEAWEALEAGADILLLDNMNPEEIRRSVERARGRALTIASGGIDLSTVRSVAETGVGLISVGSITHSAKALDLSLELER